MRSARAQGKTGASAFAMTGLGVVLGIAAIVVASRGEPASAEAPSDLTAPAIELDALPFVSDGTPLGLVEGPHFPQDEADRTSLERFELGRDLFFDTLLSADRSVSCASCHRPERGYADDVPFSRGIGGAETTRNTPSLLNRGWGRHFMWDGRFARLEEQVLDPIMNEREMGLPLEEAVARLNDEPRYRDRFASAYEAGVTEQTLARSLAAFVSRLRIGDSPIDRFQAAEGLLTPEQRAGLWIYESKGRCWKCHSGPNLTDEEFHNTGVGVVDGQPVDGRFAITGDERDRGRFKTPTLRGLELTAPYMHDGSLATLEDVVEFYRRGGGANAHLDPDMEPLDLSDDDARHLVAFLRALSREAE